MRSTLVLGVIGLLAPLAVACGTNNTSDDDDETVDCTTVTGTDTFTVGLEKKGSDGVLDFQLMSADPAPPARGNNTWVVQINAMSGGVVGSAITDATIAVTPWMPAHQHGTPVVVEITPAGTAGQYNLSPVNLWMPGVWQTTIEASTDEGGGGGSASTKDSAIYTFCLPG